MAQPRQKIYYLRRLAAALALTPLALLAYLAVRLAYIGRPVRIGTLNAKGRLSIMVSYLESYLRKLQVDGVNNPLLIVLNPWKCPNEQLSAMYARVLWLLDDRRPLMRILFTFVYRILRSRGSEVSVKLHSGHGPEFRRAWQLGGPFLSFNEAERARGRRFLADMGLPEEAAYVCFALRETAYYKQFLTAEAQACHPNPEAREDTYIRNPPLHNYLPMAMQCAELGLFVLRMGQTVDEPIPSGLSPRIVDYASKYRTAFGDIYLVSRCKFFVAGVAGLWWVASAFNRPVVMTDSPALWGSWLREGDLFLPKKMWVIAEKRCLTFREMLSVDRRYMYRSNCLTDGVELVHNTPEEIAGVVAEMNRRLDGTWVTIEEDEELQARFRSLFPVDNPGYNMSGRIGARFLRENRDLLD